MARDRPLITPERLHEAVSGLRPIEREVLLLSARDGFPPGRIAERLGITTQEAEDLLAKALCKLDRAFERAKQPWWKFW